MQHPILPNRRPITKSRRTRRGSGFVQSPHRVITEGLWYYTWKKQVLDNVASLFARGASGSDASEEERERETAKLYTKIGQLTVERDFLAKRPVR